MRRLLKRALLPASCVLVALTLVAALILPGPALGQLSRPSANPTFSSINLPASGNCLTFGANGKICGNTNEVDIYGIGIAQVLVTAGITYLNNATVARGNMSWPNGYVASGSDAISFGTNGQRLHLGTGTSDYCYSDGTSVICPNFSTTSQTNISGVTVSNFLVANGTFYPRADTITDDNNATLTFNDGKTSGTNFIFNSTATMSGSDLLMSLKNNGTAKFSVQQDGYVASAAPITLTSAYLGAAGTLLATGTVYGGHVVNKPFTVTDVTMYVGTASTATVANTVFTITDGTNTCTATFACNTSTNTTGAKTAATANGAGTGCVYAASAALSFSVTTQGCATAATVKNIDVVGKWQ